MKDVSVGKQHVALAGFSTLELMIAFAISIMIVVAVVAVSFGAQYWIVASQTSSEGLYRAKSKIEDLRAAARQSFYLASSTPFTRDTSDGVCAGGGLCYYVTGTVSDLSPCSKLAHAQVDWRVPGYGTTTTSLYTNITSPNEIVSLGGDCILDQPAGTWTGFTEAYINSSVGTPTSIDALNARAYVTTDTAPFLVVASTTPAGMWALAQNLSNFSNYVQANDIDVARDEATGRVYAYVARNDPTRQFGIIDVTDHTHIATSTMPLALAGVGGANPEGWRIKYYGNRVYITTRYTSGNEFHIINVTDKASPVEIGSGIQLGRTVDDFVVRDQMVDGAVHRFVYLASEAGTKELGVLDVTNDVLTNPSVSINLPGSVDAMSVFAAGTYLYVGRWADASGPELYVYDIWNPLDPSFVTQTPVTAEVGAGVTALRVSGDYIFMRVTQGNKLRVWKVTTSDQQLITNLQEISSYNAAVTERGVELDGDQVFVANSTGYPIRILSSQ